MPESEVIPNRFGPDIRHDSHLLGDGDHFAVFSASGGINGRDAAFGMARSQDALFVGNTRYLSRPIDVQGTVLRTLELHVRHDRLRSDGPCDLVEISNHGRTVTDLDVTLDFRADDRAMPPFGDTRRAVAVRIAPRVRGIGKFRTSRAAFDAWRARPSANLAILTADLPTDPVPLPGSRGSRSRSGATA